MLIALRKALRLREVWVEGVGRWRDPDEDLPGDFDDNRDVHYAAIGKPLGAREFTADLRKRHREAREARLLAAWESAGGRLRRDHPHKDWDRWTVLTRRDLQRR